MKKYLSAIFFLFSYVCVNAQLVYYDASEFPLLGKISEKTETRYERLPAALYPTSREALGFLGKNTAGLAIRFCTNATQIAVKWSLYKDSFMNHMAMTGIKGLDLYTLENGNWNFVNTARPDGKDNDVVVISNMEKKEREYLLYLPLYDGVTSLEIGVDSTAFLVQPKINQPERNKPVVCYGTSILQGGCASRPGMAHTNILSRWLNREFINLGFSGNGRLDYEIAEIMSEREASLYILDFMPNVNADEVREKLARFYTILRSKYPEIPVMFIENPMFPSAFYDLNMRKEIEAKNTALHEFYNSLLQKKETNICLISSERMIGMDNEATVDGIHFTDLGFMRYAGYLYPMIKERLLQ